MVTIWRQSAILDLRAQQDLGRRHFLIGLLITSEKPEVTRSSRGKKCYEPKVLFAKLQIFLFLFLNLLFFLKNLNMAELNLALRCWDNVGVKKCSNKTIREDVGFLLGLTKY